MKQRAIIISFSLALLIGIGSYAFYSFSREALKPESEASQIKPLLGPGLQASGPVRQGNADVPPPPPVKGNATSPSESEPVRTLVGVTDKRVREIERYLPQGSKVYLSPLGNDRQTAALAEADLDGDGTNETVVVHIGQPQTEQYPTPSLVLSVLTPQNNGFKIRTSVTLNGGVLFNINLEGSEMPIIVRDITSDRRPEIIVASGVGASLGGALQVFKLEDSSLNSLTKIEGNAFLVKRKSSQSYIIMAQSRYENQSATYQWNGKQFLQAKNYCSRKS